MSANEQIERKLSILAQSDVYIYLYSYLFRDSRNTKYLQNIRTYGLEFKLFYIFHSAILETFSIAHSHYCISKYNTYRMCGVRDRTILYIYAALTFPLPCISVSCHQP